MNRTQAPAAAGKTFMLPICDRTVTQEITGDFSLPDYQPEIKRLLRIGVSLTPPAAYATRDSIDVGGNADYFVLYTGNDDMLYCAPVSAEYRIATPLTDPRHDEKDSALQGNLTGWMGDEPTCLCHVSPESVSGRVTAPRRLHIKCRLDARLKAYATCPAGVSPLENAEGGPIQALTDSASCVYVMRGTDDTLTLQDDMILPPAENDRLRVVCAEGQVVVSEAIPGQGRVTCRGDVLLKLTLAPSDTAEGGLPAVSVVQRKIPFSCMLDMPDVTPDCQACAHGVCHQLSVEMQEGRLHTELGVMLETMAQRDVSVAYTKDLYATQRETSARYAHYQVEHSLSCINRNFTFSDSLPLSEVSIPSAARILDVTAAATPRELTCEKGKYHLTGDCKAHLIWQKEDEYGATELTLPFRYAFEDRRGEEDMALCADPDFQGCMQAVSCRARMDGERIGIDAELCLMLRMTAATRVTLPLQMSLGDEISRRRGEYVICFPSADDTLWTVAKRYHAPLTALTVANGLSTSAKPDTKESLDHVSYLIV